MLGSTVKNATLYMACVVYTMLAKSHVSCNTRHADVIGQMLADGVRHTCSISCMMLGCSKPWCVYWAILLFRWRIHQAVSGMHLGLPISFVCLSKISKIQLLVSPNSPNCKFPPFSLSTFAHCDNGEARCSPAAFNRVPHADPTRASRLCRRR